MTRPIADASPHTPATPPRPGASTDASSLARPLPGAPGRMVLLRVSTDFPYKLRRLLKLYDQMEELLDAICFELRRTQGPSATADDRGARRTGGLRGHVPHELPTQWIKEFETRPRADGSLFVNIDGHHVLLQPHLGALLLSLADDNGLSSDQGVGFKSLGDLAARITKRTGNAPLSDATVNKYVHRLRKQLVTRAGLRAEVIQTNRRLGRRLTLLRQQPPPAR
jgi:hypothetical protein